MSALNREGWLTEVARRLERICFKAYALKPYRVTCGWPSKFALSHKTRRVGECHALESSTAGVFELFVSPVLDDPLEVAGTVAHELAHVVAGTDAGHGPLFRKVCWYVGLTSGRPTNVMPGKLMGVRIEEMVKDLGPYPHKAMQPKMRVVPLRPKPVKLTCDCGCLVSITREWLERAGTPQCGCGEVFTTTQGS